MSFAERLSGPIDWEITKKAFLLLSVISLIFIPVDGLWIHLQRSESIPTELVSQEKALGKFEPEASYLAVFEKNTLFGNTASGLSGPMMQASVAELTKDYRLKGVILSDESEAIVEDARIQKTIFVKVGEKLGDLTVKEIRDGLIVLTYLGQEVKLEIK